MRTLMFSTAILVLTCFLSSGKNATTSSIAMMPAWRADLRAAVGSTPLGIVWGRKEYQGLPKTSLWFANGHTIVATFVVREGDKPQVSHRDTPDRTLALRLRALLVDASTGKITTTKDWPTESRNARIVAVNDGKLLALSGSELTLYSPDLAALKRIKLPPLGANFDWLPHVSPTGKNILFSSHELAQSRWIWLDTDTLNVLGSWVDTPTGHLSISDKQMVTSTCWWGYECTSVTYNANGGGACTVGPRCNSSVQIREIGADWKTIAPGEKYQRPRFVNDETIVILGKDEARLIRPDGKVLFEEPRGRRSWGCGDTAVVPSAEGHRFVVPSCDWKGGSALLDIGAYPVLKSIFVYDVSAQVRTHVFDLKGPRIKNEMAFALSPDGSELAILSDGYVEVFQLPPSQ